MASKEGGGAHTQSWRVEDDDDVTTLRGPEEPIGELDSRRGGGTVPSSGMLGVLRYKRESLNPWARLPEAWPPLQPVRDGPVTCDYCGQEATPPLDLTGGEEPQPFCCGKHQRLCETLTHERRRALEDTPPPVSQPIREEEAGLQAQQAKEREEHRKQEQKLLFQEKSTNPRRVETYSSRNTLSFQLSSCDPMTSNPMTPDPGARGQDQDQDPEHDPPGEGEGEGEGQTGPLELRCSQFGLVHHQAASGVWRKYYADGRSFLTVFPDGSAQLYYPSGLVALVLVVDRGRRVCLVYDDDDDHAHSDPQPIRALFHSDGRATCYHANGSVWLSLDRSGGQCVSEEGSRLKRWSWSGAGSGPGPGSGSGPGPGPGSGPGSGSGPGPLRPVFLSLNPRMGVRVLDRRRVSVCFLASGRQARFSVGACAPPADCEGAVPARLAPPISRDELFLFAGRIGVHLGLRRLQQCLLAPCSLRGPARPRPAPSLVRLARRLLDWSRRLGLRERDRAFVQRCLRDCL